MENSFLAVMQVIFAILFFVTLAVGGYLAKNHKRIFGANPEIPSENGSARALGSVQIWSIWVHVLIATGLVLFVITFVVNFAARWVVGRSERRMSR